MSIVETFYLFIFISYAFLLESSVSGNNSQTRGEGAASLDEWMTIYVGSDWFVFVLYMFVVVWFKNCKGIKSEEFWKQSSSKSGISWQRED